MNEEVEQKWMGIYCIYKGDFPDPSFWEMGKNVSCLWFSNVKAFLGNVENCPDFFLIVSHYSIEYLEAKSYKSS